MEEFTDEECLKIDSEFKRLRDIHYLDHAGSMLYSERQLQDVYALLSTSLFCNPHTSALTEHQVNGVRDKVLQFFNTNSNEYAIVFTKGTSDSLRTVAQCFDFQANGHFVYTRNVHNSVLGMRAIVGTKNVSVMETDEFLRVLASNDAQSQIYGLSNSLITFPAQCNFNGYKYPLEVIEKFHRHELPHQLQEKSKNWFVCLDAANYVSTSFLDLDKYRPDFVCMSFYKIFGYPTGLGALLVSKRGQLVLNKRFHGGGTVDIALSNIDFHRKKPCFHERFEDGTIPFLSIISLLEGMRTIERLIPGQKDITSMERISRHAFQLGKYLYSQLSALKYANAQRLVKFYNQTMFDSQLTQGGIVNLNVLLSNGSYVGYSEIEAMALIHNIYLRVGCFCNPGACQENLKFSNAEVLRFYSSGHICGDVRDVVNNYPMGFVRLSVGYMTTRQNVDAFVRMLKKFYLARFEVPPRTDAKRMITDILIYPVKNCPPMIIASDWELTAGGFKFDCEWTIVDDIGQEVTVKMMPNLVHIRSIIIKARNVLRLCFLQKDSIEIDLDSIESDLTLRLDQFDFGMKMKNRAEGVDCGQAVANWLSDALKRPGLRMVRRLEMRSLKKLEIGTIKAPAGLTVLNVDSVERLAEGAGTRLTVELFSEIVQFFRPNLIMRDALLGAEKTWDRIELSGDVQLKSDDDSKRPEYLAMNPTTGCKASDALQQLWKRTHDQQMGFSMNFRVTEFERSNGGVLIHCGSC